MTFELAGRISGPGPANPDDVLQQQPPVPTATDTAIGAALPLIAVALLAIWAVTR